MHGQFCEPLKHERSCLQSSPVKDALTWGMPINTDQGHMRAQRSAKAAQLRKSYDTQIEQREAMHEAYAAAEDRWPYQPTHQVAKLPYYKGPRYVAPHFAASPLRL